MKDKQKSLEDLDFLTELTPSEQEGINGGADTSLKLTNEGNTDPNTSSPTPFVPIDTGLLEELSPYTWYPDTRHKGSLTS